MNKRNLVDLDRQHLIHPVCNPHSVGAGLTPSSTALDTVLTPLLFWLFGAGAVRELLAEDVARPGTTPGETAATEAY